MYICIHVCGTHMYILPPETFSNEIVNYLMDKTITATSIDKITIHETTTHNKELSGLKCLK